MRNGTSVVGHLATLAASLLLTATGARAVEYDLRGYVKDYPTLWRAPESSGMPEGWLNTVRARLKGRWFATSRITFAADYEMRAVGGSVVDDPVYAIQRGTETQHRELFDLSSELISDGSFYLTHTLDRAYAEVALNHLTAVVGRQRVAWGVTSFFSPLDLFAPFAVGEIDKEEKAGIDAVKVSFPWGQLSNVELIYSPMKEYDTWNDTRLGGRFRTNVANTDLSIVAGHFRNRDVAGGSVVRSVHGALLKAEALGTRADGVTYHVDSQGLPVTSQRRETTLSASLGAEYGFPWRNLTVAAEFYHDGSGRTDPQQYEALALASGTRTTLGQHYAAGSASILITPLLTASCAALANLDDGSGLVSPLLEYSFSENLYAKAGAQIYLGEATRSGSSTLESEFGSAPDIWYLGLSWYF